MNATQLLAQYPAVPSPAELEHGLAQAQQLASQYHTPEGLQQAFGLMDLTSLNTTDTEAHVRRMAQKVNDFGTQYPQWPSVAAICVYPNLVAAVREQLTDKHFDIASVVGAFPSSQSFVEVKTLETRLAVAAGATEVDMVISVGAHIEGQHQRLLDEVRAVKAAAGAAHVKVILESGLLTHEQIWQAALLAMEAGADFIKTSTGKVEPAASPEAAWLMCRAIEAFYQKRGVQVGFKPAGGIRSPQEAMVYLSIVRQTLGEGWIRPTLLRIGASALANNLLAEYGRMTTGTPLPAYF